MIYIYVLNLVVYVYVIVMNRMLWWIGLAILEIRIDSGINGVTLVVAFQMTLINYPSLDSYWYQWGSIGADIP